MAPAYILPFLTGQIPEISAMVLGRIVWGAVMFICMGIKGGAFTFSAFLASAVLNAVPGILKQIILIPILVMVIEKTKK